VKSLRARLFDHPALQSLFFSIYSIIQSCLSSSFSDLLSLSHSPKDLRQIGKHLSALSSFDPKNKSAGCDAKKTSIIHMMQMSNSFDRHAR
jgi:hypothetical protein